MSGADRSLNPVLPVHSTCPANAGPRHEHLPAQVCQRAAPGPLEHQPGGALRGSWQEAPGGLRAQPWGGHPAPRGLQRPKLLPQLAAPSNASHYSLSPHSPTPQTFSALFKKKAPMFTWLATKMQMDGEEKEEGERREGRREGGGREGGKQELREGPPGLGPPNDFHSQSEGLVPLGVQGALDGFGLLLALTFGVGNEFQLHVGI